MKTEGNTQLNEREFCRMVDAIAKLTEEAQSAGIPQWIATTEQLPPIGEWVLVIGLCDNGEWWKWCGIGQWDGKHWQQDAGQVINDLECEGIDWGAHDINVAPYSSVSHWMPLPPMPYEIVRGR